MHSEQGDLGPKKWTMSGEHRSEEWGGGHLQKGLQGFTVQPLCSTDASPKIKPTKVQCSQIPLLRYVSSWGKWIHPKKKKWNPARHNIFPCDITSTFSTPQVLFPKCHQGSSPCLSHPSATLTPLHPACISKLSGDLALVGLGEQQSEETVSLLPDSLPANCPWLGRVPVPVAQQLSGAFSVQAWPPLVRRQSCGW